MPLQQQKHEPPTQQQDEDQKHHRWEQWLNSCTATNNDDSNNNYTESETTQVTGKTMHDSSGTLETLQLHSSMGELSSSSGAIADINHTHNKPRAVFSTSENAASGCTKPPPQPPTTARCGKTWTWLWRHVSMLRQGAGRVVNRPRVQLAIVVLIVLNALTMGVATLDFVTNSPRVSYGFRISDTVFLVVFTIEIALQVLYHGVLPGVFTDPWLSFDLVVVVLSWGFAAMQIIRAFRALRAVRLVTRVDSLRNLVHAIFNVAPSMSAILCLLVLVIFIYTVLCTMLFGDLYERGITDDDYFGHLGKTAFTLFQFVTLDWADIVRQVVAVYYWAWFVFSTFLILTSFILYSLVIAVVCDAVSVQEHAGDASKEEDDADAETTKRRTQQDAETDARVHQLQQRIHELTQQQEQLLEMVHECLIHTHSAAVNDNDSLESSEDLSSPIPRDSCSMSSFSPTSSEGQQQFEAEHWTGTTSRHNEHVTQLDLTIQRSTNQQQRAYDS